VVNRIRQVREQRYSLMRGFFYGATDEAAEPGEPGQARMHSVALNEGAYAIGKSLRELDLDSMLVDVTAVRRRNIRGLEPSPDMRLEEGDVLVLLGAPENLGAAEIRLLQG
jgi:CPA2 family monovalent cation:H+ antiporter-2